MVLVHHLLLGSLSLVISPGVVRAARCDHAARAVERESHHPWLCLTPRRLFDLWLCGRAVGMRRNEAGHESPPVHACQQGEPHASDVSQCVKNTVGGSISRYASPASKRGRCDILIFSNYEFTRCASLRERRDGTTGRARRTFTNLLRLFKTCEYVRRRGAGRSFPLRAPPVDTARSALRSVTVEPFR